MTPTAPKRRIAAVWTAVKPGALLRLTIDGAPLSIAWSQPACGEWATGVGIEAEGDGELVWRDGPPPACPGPWFGGWSFDREERWVLPSVLAWGSAGGAWAAAFGDHADEKLARISQVDPVTQTPAATVRGGNRIAWTSMVDAALAQIAGGAVSKVVLARQIRVEADAAFEERRVLEALEARFPSCRTFLLRAQDGSAFLGATPETLCRVRGRQLDTEALAGTGEPDQLLSSQKDRREHSWVVEGIVDALRPYSSRVEVEPAPALRHLANVSHLWTPIRAQLKQGVEPIEAARALHPTPAVGGTPRVKALEFIRAHEGFDRGWYAGAIGVRGSDALDLWVGIRSAQVSGASARVFAGAGVVAGSTADSEWEETERKAQAVLGALGAPPQLRQARDG